jgi:SAM-dependent methyltransferase
MVRAFYEQAEPTRRVVSDTHVTINASLLSLLEPGKSAPFLDIGCYDGTKTHALAQFMRAERPVGTDFLVNRLHQAQSYGVQPLVIDLNNGAPLPFADNSFRFIFVGDVIEHIFSPDHLLQEIKRLLCPGGYAVLTTPNLASWRNRLVLLLGWQPFTTEVSTQYRVGNPRMPAGVPSGHIRIFAPRALRELPEKYGLQVEALSGLIPHAGLPGLSGQIFRFIDMVLLHLHPTLADELIIKVRNP